MSNLAEVGRTADAVRKEIENLFIRGLAAASAKDRGPLKTHTDEWERIGAHHVASRLRAALDAAAADARDAPRKFLAAYTSLHGFERVLSLEAAKEAWALRAALLGEASATPVATPASLASAPAVIDDAKGTSLLLEDLVRVVEDLVRTGLTSATTATRTKLDAAFKEASRRKLLRLGASLRYVNDEIGRFLADDGSFGARRYGFFLHRSWLLGKGLLRSLAQGDKRLYSSLTVGTIAPPSPIGDLQVIVLGVAKRTVAGACTFDFRLRVTKGKGLVQKSLVFSLVFARKEGVPAEGYLHLPQPQKYAPKIFCEGNELSITEAALIPDGRGGGRLILGPKSTVTSGKPPKKWAYSWDPRGAEERAGLHVPSPLDLAVELVEEIVLDSWEFVDRGDEGGTVHGNGLTMSVNPGADSKDVFSRLRDAAGDKEKPALFGTVHYEFGNLVLMPLSFLASGKGPQYLMLSDDKINLTSLLGSLNLGG